MATPYPNPNPYPGPVSAGTPGTFPRRMGKPRSFWVVLGLGIITFGIYFIVYHYLVTLELKDSVRWEDEDSYSPTAFLWFYSAYIVLSLVAPAMAGTAIMISFLPEIISAGSEFDFQSIPSFVKFKDLMLVYGAFSTALALYITFYFLKLNDLAAEKVGARRLGITLPMALFVIVYFFSFISDVANSMFGGSRVDADNFSGFGGASVLAMVGLGFLVFFFSILILGGMLVAYWKQTELANHVWLEGDFGDRPAAPQAQYEAPTPAPPLPTPPPAPTVSQPPAPPQSPESLT